MSYLNKDSKVPKVLMYDQKEGYDMRLHRDDSKHYEGKGRDIYEEEKSRAVPMRSSSVCGRRPFPVVSLTGRQYAPVPEDNSQYNPRQHNTNLDKQQISPDGSSCILSRDDWERIQSLLNQPKAKKYTRQEMLDSNAVSQFSKAENKRVQVDMEEKLRQKKSDEAEKFKKLQVPKQIVNEKLAVSKKKQAATSTHKQVEKLSKATVEQDAKVAKQQKDKEENRAAMLKSIFAYRDKKAQEKEQNKKEEQQSKLDWFQAKKASDRLFLEEKKQKAKRNTDNKINCRDINATITAEKHARLKQLKREDRDAAQKQAEQIAEKDKQVQQYVQRELHKAADKDVQQLLAASTGRRGVISEMGEPSYYSIRSDEPLPRFATDQTRLMKQYLERNSLQLGMDTKPVHLPSISRAAHLKSNNASAAKEVTVRRCPTALPRLSTAQNLSTKQHLECDKLQLTNKGDSMVDLQLTRFPPISTKETPAEKHCLSKGEERFLYHLETGESLPIYATEQTRYIKQRQERNKLLPRRP
ncbi:caldesmon-like [Sander lucioperca]|uniref:caldesmon-like n=1 Tax=Sander lucioperca TaxID=283035 RepID=UPI00165362BA|nr:caldesmon-like [Sander lucioperca]